MVTSLPLVGCCLLHGLMFAARRRLTVVGPGKVGPSWQPTSRPHHHSVPPGWITGLGHATFTESFAQEIPFSASLYEIHQLALTRTKFTVTAESARAQHTSVDGSQSDISTRAVVIPYLSLGAAYRPNTTFSTSNGGLSAVPNFPISTNVADFPFVATCYDVGFDPDLSTSASIGGLINQGGRTFNSRYELARSI
jgi:hypothetical protein